MVRNLNDNAINAIKKLHKFMPRAVKAGNIWMIGYGHQCSTPDLVVTEEKAVELLRADMVIHAACVERSVKVPLTDNQFAALAVFAAHVSDSQFQQSKLLALLNRGWYDQVPAAMIKWSRTGTPNSKIRRAAEVALWRKEDEPVEQEERAA